MGAGAWLASLGVWSGGMAPPGERAPGSGGKTGMTTSTIPRAGAASSSVMPGGVQGVLGARVGAGVRAHVWSLIAARPGGSPWLAIAGKVLAGWLVIDLDGTLITARSDK